MRITSAALPLFAAVLICRSGIARAETYTIDPVHTAVIYRIGHMQTSNSWGRFNESSGTITLDDADPSKNAIEITINAASIDSGNPKRDEHLRSPDFLNAKEFPAITFKSNQVKPIDAKMLEVAGTLTLHGVSKPLTLKVERIGAGKSPMGDTRVGLDTGFQIKRSDFDMKNMIPGAGDDVLLNVSVEAFHK